MQPTSDAEALLIPDRSAAALRGISRAHLHRLRAAGKWGPAPIKLGRKILYDRTEVTAWVAARCPDARTWEVMRAMGKRLRVAP